MFGLVGMATLRVGCAVSEKQPWKDVPEATGVIESEFVWPALLGEQVLPYRTLDPELFVVPLTPRGDLLTGDDSRIDRYPGLAAWMRQVEPIWDKLSGGRMSLTERFDYMKGLTQQVPSAGQRVVYAKAGMHVAAALVTNDRVLIDHTLYWGAVASAGEGRYLVAILNSPSLTELVRPLMSYGKDERHIDKHVWKLPIPAYDPADPVHQRITELAAKLEAELHQIELTSDYFVTSRKHLRAAIAASPTGRTLDRLVRQLVDPDHVPADPDGENNPAPDPTALARMFHRVAG